MAIKAGTRFEFEGSMAEAIEKAFFREWKNYVGEQSTPQSHKYLRLMFIAIAQGVVAHLKKNEDAITVEYGGSTLDADINISGTTVYGVQELPTN